MKAIGDGIVVFCCYQLKSDWERELELLEQPKIFSTNLSQCRKGILCDPTREETVRMPNYCLETPRSKQVQFSVLLPML